MSYSEIITCQTYSSSEKQNIYIGNIVSAVRYFNGQLIFIDSN